MKALDITLCSAESDSCNPLDCSPSGSVGLPRQEYWRVLPFPPPGDLPNKGMELESLASPALEGGLFIAMPPGKPGYYFAKEHFKHQSWDRDDSVALLCVYATKVTREVEQEPPAQTHPVTWKEYD